MNAQGGYAALYQGYEMIVRLLVENGVDINAQGVSHSTALGAGRCFGERTLEYHSAMVGQCSTEATPANKKVDWELRESNRPYSRLNSLANEWI